MNPQIQKLLEQAKAESSQWQGSKPATTITYDELEKFAELIVRECAGVELYWLNEQNRKAVAEKIKEHFGVEE